MPDPMLAGEPIATVGKAAAWCNVLPVALIISDGAGRIMQWAKAAPELLGYTADEAIGRTITDLVLPGSSLAVRTVQDSVASGRSVTGLFPVRHKNTGPAGTWGRLCLERSGLRSDYGSPHADPPSVLPRH
jgi:PAS domain-containing protein